MCDACSDCVVVLVLGAEYSRPFQLSLFRTVGGKSLGEIGVNVLIWG